MKQEKKNWFNAGMQKRDKFNVSNSGFHQEATAKKKKQIPGDSIIWPAQNISQISFKLHPTDGDIPYLAKIGYGYGWSAFIKDRQDRRLT